MKGRVTKRQREGNPYSILIFLLAVSLPLCESALPRCNGTDFSARRVCQLTQWLTLPAVATAEIRSAWPSRTAPRPPAGSNRDWDRTGGSGGGYTDAARRPPRRVPAPARAD